MTAKKDLKKRIRNRQAKTGESYTTARAHVIRASDPDSPGQSRPAGLMKGVVLKCNASSIRILLPGDDGTVTLRTSHFDAWRIAPGQFVEIEPTKQWQWRDDAYASGTIKRVWTDIPAIGLDPLPLTDHGLSTLSETCEPFTKPDPYAETWAFLSPVQRREFEFDPIAWGASVGIDQEDVDTHLITDAARLSAYNPDAARTLLMQALVSDLRCIDAHVHLGNLRFGERPEEALVHYEIAVAVGNLSLGPEFNGLLRWAYLYNRPYLRALHGYGLCLWRLGNPGAASHVFERIFSLNPTDNQGVRFCWDDIRNDRAWKPDEPIDFDKVSSAGVN